MFSFRSAILSGFIATFVTSLILMMKNAFGQFPEVHIAQTLSKIAGTPDNLLVGGLLFLAVGIVILSPIYAFLCARLPVRSVFTKGMLFGVGLWLAVMIILMPIAGAGVFALERSAVVPAVDLVLCLIYGLVLAVAYAWDNAGRAEPMHS